MRGGTRFRRSTSMRGGKNNGRIPPSQQQGTAQMQDTQADHAAIQQNSVPPITQQDAIPPSVQSTDAPREPSQHTSVASTPNDVDTTPSPSSAPRTNSAVVSTMSRSKRRITVTNKEYVLIYMHSKNVTFFELLIILCLDFEYTFFLTICFKGSISLIVRGRLLQYLRKNCMKMAIRGRICQKKCWTYIGKNFR